MTRKIETLLSKHAAELEAIGRSLAMDFETPAQRTINAGFARMGVDRFTRSGDDLWEMHIAQKSGWEYTKPPRRLVDRWASY